MWQPITGACLSVSIVLNLRPSISRCLQSLCFFISLCKERKEISKTTTKTLLSPLSPLLEESNSWDFWDSHANGISLSLSLSVFDSFDSWVFLLILLFWVSDVSVSWNQNVRFFSFPEICFWEEGGLMLKAVNRLFPLRERFWMKRGRFWEVCSVKL